MTKTQIANMALAHLASTKFMSDYTTDTTKEKAVLDVFYDAALARIFRDFDWPFALRIATLTLVASNPTDEWYYSYRYPATAARVTRIISDVWPETEDARVAYRILSDGTGRLIYTNKESAEAEYVVVETDTTKWPSDFVEAFALLWASLAAAGITAGDQFKRGATCLALYEASLNNTYFNTMNEEKPTQPAESKFITVRD